MHDFAWMVVRHASDVWQCQCITPNMALSLKIFCTFQFQGTLQTKLQIALWRNFNEQKLVDTFFKFCSTLSNIACMSGGGAAINLNFLWKDYQSLQVNIMSAARPCLLQPRSLADCM